MENNIEKYKPRPLPKIEDLYKDLELSFQQNELNRLLNMSPKQEWIKQNKYANNSNYIPIAIQESLLTAIYIKWKVEIKSVQVVANSVVVTVRVIVRDPITGEEDWQEGIGAAPIQTEKGAAATDFTKVNTLAVQMAAPAAETYAFKDAVEKFGKLFGKDINRDSDKQLNIYSMLETKFNNSEKKPIPDELIAIINETDDKDKLAQIYEANPELHSNPKLMQLLNARKKEINGTVNA